jgi:hypothetical protein
VWRFAGASVLGTSHVGSGAPCQDAHRSALYRDVAGADVLVLCACDGAGTAARADEGAQLAVAAFHVAAQRHFAANAAADFDEHALARLVAEARAAIEAGAAQVGEKLRAFACTFLAAVIGPATSGFCQIGDGVMVVAERSDELDWSWVFWPQRGEFANATSFLTDEDALDAIEIEVSHRTVDEIAMLTDGIESMVLKYDTRTVFAPFFETMFAPIRASGAFGEDQTLSGALKTYLNSQQVNQRTDDDKTLVLATRRGQGDGA